MAATRASPSEGVRANEKRSDAATKPRMNFGSRYQISIAAGRRSPLASIRVTQ